MDEIITQKLKDRVELESLANMNEVSHDKIKSYLKNYGNDLYIARYIQKHCEDFYKQK